MDRTSITSSPAPSSPTNWSSEPELTQYAAISPWAVATLLAGLAAPLALLSPLLWWVPLVAIPLAILAHRQLQQTDPKYVGQKALIAGLCLAAVCLAWAVTRRVSREVRITGEATTFASDWLQLILDGKLQEAHQLQSAAARRQAPGVDLAAFYTAQAEAKKDLDAFLQTEVIAALAGKNGQITFAAGELIRHTVDGPTDYFTLRFAAASGELKGPVWIAIRRERRSDSTASEWQIMSFSFTEPAGPF